MTIDLAAMRRQYANGSLDEATAPANPVELLERWLDDAKAISVVEANAMVVATVDQHNSPTARTVLLKGLDDRGLVFFTNYGSQKGRDLAGNPHIAAVFTWTMLERQIRVSGLAEPISAEDSDAYFETRPRGSQIGAAASPQSEPVPDRAWLEARFAKLAESDEPIARPATWGGYRIVPGMFEFWQGRADRLHDRLRYDRVGEGWEIIRLAP